MQAKVDPGIATAVAAALISISALTVSIYEAYLQRQEQRVSVWPIIEHWTAYDGDTFSVHIANKGIGPAIIADVEVAYTGAVMKTWADVFAEPLGDDAAGFSQSLLIGNVMAPGEASTIVSYTNAGTAAWRASRKISTRICYCSVFGDCWNYQVSDLLSGRPIRDPVQHCPEHSDRAF